MIASNKSHSSSYSTSSPTRCCTIATNNIPSPSFKAPSNHFTKCLRESIDEPSYEKQSRYRGTASLTENRVGGDAKISGAKIEPLDSDQKEGVERDPGGGGAAGKDSILEQARIDPGGQQGTAQPHSLAPLDRARYVLLLPLKLRRHRKKPRSNHRRSRSCRPRFTHPGCKDRATGWPGSAREYEADDGLEGGRGQWCED